MIQQIEELTTAGVVPGIACGVLASAASQEYYFGHLGSTPAFCQLPVTAASVYDLASLTKAIATTTRVLQLIDQGRLAWDTCCSEVLPQYPHLVMTVAELLLHRSGLPADFADKGRFSAGYVADYLDNCRPVPGQAAVYSDIGYLLLGFMIEEIDQTDLESSFQQQLFQPLGMKDTSYFPPADSQFVPTEILPDRGQVVGVVHDSKAFRYPRPIGSAGLFAPLPDVVKFCHALLQNRLPSGARLFSEVLYGRLLTEVVDGRGLGWEKPFARPSQLFHTGFTGGAIGLDLIAGKGLILLTNRVHPSRDNLWYLKKRTQIYREFFGGRVK